MGPSPPAKMAVIFSTFTALGAIPLYTLGFLPSLSSPTASPVSIWCVSAGLLGLLLGMLLGRPGKVVFLDKVCLNEGPEGTMMTLDFVKMMNVRRGSGGWPRMKLFVEVI